MKVLMLSTDRKIFEDNSAVRQRMVEYGRLFERLDIVVFSKGNFQPARQQGEFPISNVQISDNVWVYPTNSRSKAFYVFDAFKIGRKIIENYRDVVISTQDPFETGIVGVLLKLRYKLSLQIQVHTDFANRYFVTHSLLNFIRFPLGLFVLSFADSVRVVSKRIEKSIHSLTHNISILPILTSPLASHSPLLHKEKEENKEINFLTVARLEKEKDLETAIYAFKKVLEKIEVEDPERSQRALFTVVGEGGEINKLKHLCKTLNIEKQVIFAGWQDNLENYYKNVDIYISTSLYEGYGMSTVEAASFGLPLVLSDTGVAQDIFKDNQEAFICKQKDVSSFAKAMIRLASNKNLMKKMGQLAREAVIKHQISYPEYLDKYKNSIQQALNFYNFEHGIFKRNILLRYLVAGATSTSVNIGLLYILTDIFGIWYLYSSLFSFIVAVGLSFILQKFWTFNDGEIKKVHHQLISFLSVALLGIFINTIFMYIFVDIFDIWYILAQIITGGFIMILNFLMYKFFIFNK